MSKPTTIYAILDPRNNEVRYVGKSAWFAHRKSNHLREAKKGTNTTHVYRWIGALLKQDLKPEFIELETVPIGEDWVEAEKFWISYLKSLGASLCNHSSGGDGICGYKYNEEQLIEHRIRIRRLYKEGIIKPKKGEGNSQSKLSQNDVKLILFLYYSTNNSLVNIAKLFNYGDLTPIVHGYIWKELDWYRLELAAKYNKRHKKEWLTEEIVISILEFYYSNPDKTREHFNKENGITISQPCWRGIVYGYNWPQLHSVRKELIEKYGIRGTFGIDK